MALLSGARRLRMLESGGRGCGGMAGVYSRAVPPHRRQAPCRTSLVKAAGSPLAATVRRTTRLRERQSRAGKNAIGTAGVLRRFAKLVKSSNPRPCPEVQPPTSVAAEQAGRFGGGSVRHIIVRLRSPSFVGVSRKQQIPSLFRNARLYLVAVVRYNPAQLLGQMLGQRTGLRWCDKSTD